MSLEQELAKNTAAIEALTAAIKSGAVVTSDTGNVADEAAGNKKTAAAGNKKTSAASNKKADVVDAETLKAKLIEFKTLTDLKTAKALVAKHGFDSIADVTEDKSKSVFDAIVKAIADLDNGNQSDDEPEDDL